MLFFLKKFIAQFFFPIPLVLLLLAFSVVVAFRKKTDWWLKAPLLLAFLLLFFGSFRATSYFTVKPLETVFPPIGVGSIPFTEEARKAKYIVVLGGGLTPIFNVPPASRLSQTSLSRLVEGVRLANLLPQTKLIFTGGQRSEAIAIADAMSMAATAMGMPPERIIALPSALDTAEEARSVTHLVGTQPFILVTSATHLPRAMKLFQSLGMQPIAAPAQFIADNAPFWNWQNLRWDADSLENSTVAVYEYMGNLWGFLNRWFAHTEKAKEASQRLQPKPYRPTEKYAQPAPGEIQKQIDQTPAQATFPQNHAIQSEAGVGGEAPAKTNQ